MHANLMRAAGFRRHPQRRETVEAFDHFVLRLRRPAGDVIAANRHFFPLIRVRADRQIDHVAVQFRAADHDRKIFFLHGARGELLGQRIMGGVGFGDDQHAAGVAIQADARFPAAMPRRRR